VRIESRMVGFLAMGEQYPDGRPIHSRAR
jgi:hypothetical protein